MDRLTEVQENIAVFSRWLDEHNAHLDPLAQLLLRTGKITEENGEVEEALIGAVGQNPRKGVTHTWDDVDKELLDVIFTAAGALEHRHGNKGVLADMLLAHTRFIVGRVGLDAVLRPSVAEGERILVLAWDANDSWNETAPRPPVVGTVRYVGSRDMLGQPAVNVDDWDGPNTGYASSWERV